MKEISYTITSHDSTPFGYIKPSLMTYKSRGQALLGSIGFCLTKIEHGGNWVYFYQNRQVEINDVTWNAEDGVLTYTFNF